MTIMALIIVGGIGFLTWEDIKNNKWNFKKYRMQDIVMQKINKLKHRHITSFQIIILGFLSVILLGSLFLMLPIATKDGQITPLFLL